MKEVLAVILFFAVAAFAILPLMRSRTRSVSSKLDYIRSTYANTEGHLVERNHYRRAKGSDEKNSLMPKSFVTGRYEYYSQWTNKKYRTAKVEARTLPYAVTIYYDKSNPKKYYIEGIVEQKSSALSGFIYVGLLLADLILCRVIYSLL